MRSSNLAQLLTFSLYSYATFQATFAAAENQAYFVGPFSHHDMVSNTSVSYRWMTGNVDYYVNENQLALTYRGHEKYKKIFTALPYQISHQCGAMMTLQPPLQFEQVSFLGQSKGFGSTNYLGLLFVQQSIARDLFFENCVRDKLDDYLTKQRAFFIARERSAIKALSILIPAFLVILGILCKFIKNLMVEERNRPPLDLEMMFRVLMEAQNHAEARLLQENSTINNDRMEKAEIEESTVPNEFICPITHTIMDVPVTTSEADLTSAYQFPRYDEIAISNWFATHRYAPHAPHVLLTDFSLKKDTVLQDKIEDFLKKGESLFARRQQRAHLRETETQQRKMRARSK